MKREAAPENAKPIKKRNESGRGCPNQGYLSVERLIWELRPVMNVARLWRDHGKRRHAHDLLALVYGWLTEGFDTLDLKEAKSLLEQLNA